MAAEGGHMVRYPVTLSPDDNDTILVTFPDFPEAHTFGDDKSEAPARAVDALETVIDAYIRDRRAIPTPSAITKASVTLSSLAAAKVQIYNAMRQQHIGKADLAKRLGAHLPQIDRLLDVRHGSKLEQLEAAAHALGADLDVVLVVREPGPQGGQPGQMMPVRTVKASASPTPRRRRVPLVHAGVLAAQETKIARRSLHTATKKK
jgi:antitoxin HicB